MSTLNVLKELISIDSRFTESNRQIVDYLKRRFANLETKEHEFIKKDSKKELSLYNLVVKLPGTNSTNPLVFSGHTDTVEIGKGWTLDPFSAIERDGKIYGLGASDMKAGLACIIAAALRLDKRPDRDIYLLFDADEEGSGLGGKKMIEDLHLSGGQVIIAEPTDRNIVYGQKGCLDFIVETEGIALHSSNTNLANNLKNNAIYRMFNIQHELMKYEESIEEKSDSLFGQASFNMGQISGGVGANVVADYCKLNASRRLLPTEDIYQEFNKIKELVSNIDPKAKVTETFLGESFITDKNSTFARRLSSLSQEYLGNTRFDIKMGWTEAALFSKYGETFIFGPGTSEMCHKADEYVLIEDLEFFTKIYHSLMSN